MKNGSDFQRRVVAVNGSPRPEGNTARLLDMVCRPLQARGILTERLQLGGSRVHGCSGCRKCFENLDQRCVFTDDPINGIIAAMGRADGIILGSPTYFANVTTEMKALIDRAGYVSRANGFMFARKVGAAVVAVRRAGAIHAWNSINHFLHISQMVQPGSIYWNLGIGREPGEVEKDEEGCLTMERLGENMAWLLLRLNRIDDGFSE